MTAIRSAFLSLLLCTPLAGAHPSAPSSNPRDAMPVHGLATAGMPLDDDGTAATNDDRPASAAPASGVTSPRDGSGISPDQPATDAPVEPPPLVERRRTAPTVTLVSPGEEPRQVQRLSLADGAAIRFEFALEQSLQEYLDGDRNIAERPIPLRLQVEGRASRRDEGYTIALHVVRATPTRVRFAQQEEIDLLEQAASAVAGARFEIDLNDRAIVSAVRAPDPALLSPVAGMWIPRVARALEDALVAWPEEPIGAGASWTIAGPQVVSLLSLPGSVTCTMERVENGTRSISLRGKHGATRVPVPFVFPDGPLANVQDLMLMTGVYRTVGRMTSRDTEPFPIGGRIEWSALLTFNGIRNGARIDYRPSSFLRATFGANAPAAPPDPADPADPSATSESTPSGDEGSATAAPGTAESGTTDRE